MSPSSFCACLLCLPACMMALGGGSSEKPLPPAADLPSREDLPDPLVLFDGRRVASRRQWESERRPELKRLFQHYMYGYFPPRAPVQSSVSWEDAAFLGGKATIREVSILPARARAPFHLLMVVPNARRMPAPLFLGIAFCGNHAVVSHPKVQIPSAWMYPGQQGVENNRANEAGRGSAAGAWNVEQSIDRGYAVATFYNGEVEPDDPNTREGIRAAYARESDKPDQHAWGAIAAWAWGIQRAVDYLVTDRDIDAKRIAVVGHSRNGKAALVAAAFDERIALVIPHQAGCGGTAPSRGTVGESVRQINTSFPHWFDGEFKQFNDHPDRLPFDQHSLVALVAPRPVLLSNAQEDTWANPAGQFEMLRAADPVYRLLGQEGLAAARMPPAGDLLNSRLGYFIRPGSHSMTKQDWKVFLDYADRNLRR